jgi:DNA-directed RNA polymerase subunit RPC12/RpoP
LERAKTLAEERTPYSAAPAERRKKPGLNIYVNKHPEWSRQMSRGNLNFRKKAGLRCPHCGSSDTRESATKGIWDFLMRWFDYSYARCRNCSARFRVSKQQFGPDQTAD